MRNSARLAHVVMAIGCIAALVSGCATEGTSTETTIISNDPRAELTPVTSVASSAPGEGQSYYFGNMYNTVTTADFCEGFHGEFVGGMLGLESVKADTAETSDIPGQLLCQVTNIDGYVVGRLSFDQVSFEEARTKLQASGATVTEERLANRLTDEVLYAVGPGKLLTMTMKMNMYDDRDDATVTLLVTPMVTDTLPSKADALVAMREVYQP